MYDVPIVPITQVNSQRDTFKTVGKDKAFENIAAALLEAPVFADQAKQGAVVTGKKVRTQYNTFMKKMKNANDRSEFVSGTREGEFGEQIMRAVDEALALDDEAEEERNRLKAGQVAELQHKEQQGDKVR
ncbi:unnamed protein product, partial [Ectocarpus fasciculatus]